MCRSCLQIEENQKIENSLRDDVATGLTVKTDDLIMKHPVLEWSLTVCPTERPPGAESDLMLIRQIN